MEKLNIGGTEVELVIGDVTMLEVDAFVFYARPDLELGSGFGTAISVRGGPSIKKELADLAPLETGEAVVTAGGNLKARFIIHAVGPRFQEKNTSQKLRTTMISALRRADEKEIKSIAFPPMGAGFYGIPLPVCADVMVETIREYLERANTLEKVVIVALDSREYRPFEHRLETLRRKEVVT